MIDFASILVHCRIALRDQQAGWRQDPDRTEPLQDLDELAPSFNAALPHYRWLFLEGTVVWAAVVQANMDCYLDGDVDLPANVVISPSSAFDGNPGFLLTIARRLLGLKNTKPLDPDLEIMASLITDEHNFASNELVPDKITGGHEVYLTSSVMHRACFPDRMVGDMIFPMMICPERTFVSLVLPSTYWPREGIDQFGGFEHAALLSCAFPEVRESFEPRWPVDPDALHPDVMITNQVVDLTSRAADRLREIAADEGRAGAFLRASAHPGPRYALSLEEEFDAANDIVIASQGIQVIVSAAEVATLTGMVIDYRSGPLATGFVFHSRRPNNNARC